MLETRISRRYKFRVIEFYPWMKMGSYLAERAISRKLYKLYKPFKLYKPYKLDKPYKIYKLYKHNQTDPGKKLADFQRRYNGLRIKALKINLRKLYKQTLSIKFLKISLTLERLSHFRRRKKDCLQLRLRLYVSNFLSTHSDVLARDKLTLKLLETVAQNLLLDYVSS